MRLSALPVLASGLLEGRVDGSVSTSVAEVVATSERVCHVVATTRSAAYLACGVSATPVLALLSADAVRVPNGVVLPLPAEAEPFNDLRPGATVLVGRGMLKHPVLRVVGRSTWSPPHVHLTQPERALARTSEFAHLLAVRGLPPPPELAKPEAALARALLRGDERQTRRATRALIGRGPGLTPSGDDVLCGLLIGLAALRDKSGDLGARTVRTVVDDHRSSTTTASGALLVHAARGEAIPELAELLRTLESASPLTPALAALLAVGHHSGSDLARGILLALWTVGGSSAQLPARSARTVR